MVAAGRVVAAVGMLGAGEYSRAAVVVWDGVPVNFARLGVRAAVVSFTDAMVCFGPRIRRTFRKPSSANKPVTASIRMKTIRNAAQRQSQVSSNSARNRNRKKVE